MKSELINVIENLNTRNYDNYKFLIFDIREKIELLIKNRKDENLADKDESQKNQQKHYLKQLSINFIIDKFNIKLHEYVETFFFNQELIRNVIVNYPEEQKVIYDRFTGAKLNYFLSISRFSELKMDPIRSGPMWEINEKKGMNLAATMRYREIVEERMKSEYYIKKYKPKPNKGSSSCFIATYAYDSCENDNVVLLRNFRDSVLLDSKLGEWLVNQYYKFSPPIVIFFERIKFSKRLLRILLYLIIRFIKR
jgi:hypothetical protein